MPRGAVVPTGSGGVQGETAREDRHRRINKKGNRFFNRVFTHVCGCLSLVSVSLACMCAL